MLVLTRRDVEAAIELDALEQAIAEALAGLAEQTWRQPPRVQFRPEGSSARLGLMPAYRAEGQALFAVKSVVVAPDNNGRGLDTHQGVVVLHDGVDGRVVAVIDATSITALRTAAASAVATRLLARSDCQVIAILGTGTQARAHVASMRRVFPRAAIRIWGRSNTRAEMLAEELDLQACASPEAAASKADVICTVTAAGCPILNRAMVSPGCHVNAVGASAPDRREIAGDLIAAASRFVDSRAQATAECGEFLLAQREGLLLADHPCAEIGEVLLGQRAGRVEDTEITVFKSLGLAVEDLAAAALALNEALRRGLGQAITA